MKKIGYIYIGLLCLLLTACSNNKEPLIEIKAKISPISKEEYSRVGSTEEINNPKQEDFKVFGFNLNMEHSDAVAKRQIMMFEDWEKTLNSIDGIQRYWYGESSEKDNPSENSAEYHQEFVFYANGLSETEIKQAFKQAKITVFWTDNDNKARQEKHYIISDLIEFSSE